MSYPGSKGQAGVWQRIIGQMPPHSLYVEPFAGSAQVFFRKRPAAVNVLIDADAGVAGSLRAMATNAGFGVPRSGSGNAVTGTPGRALVDVIHGDGLAWLELADGRNGQDLIWSDNALIYCDPPYVLSTRQSRRYYNHEMSDADHVRMIAALRTIKARVLISGYPCSLYSSQLQDWRCCSYRTRTRGRTVTECLWMNFPEPGELHDWRYAGQSHRERVSLKRLATRWLARLEAMPPRKRGYVLATIAQR